MSKPLSKKTARPGSVDEIARQWQSLAERRRQHLLELHRSGRWRRYYAEDQFLARMRDAVRAIEEWRTLSGEQPAELETGAQPLDEAAE